MQIWGLLASIGISFAASFLFAYILYWLDLYEKEPLLLLGGTFLWGAVVAAGGAFNINTIFGAGVFLVTGSETATNLTTSAIVAPIIEEILKGFAVFLIFIIFTREFDSIMDGIVYAGVAALGFAASENAFYIYSYGFAQTGWEGFRSLALVRIGLVGWQHPFYTAFFGIGLAFSRLSRKGFIKFGAPLIGLATAIIAHALHNILASLFQSPAGLAFTTFLDWLGWLLMFFFIITVMVFEGHQIKKYLKPEIDKGTLTEKQYNNASSAIKILFHRFRALFKGKCRQHTKFYRTAAELAIKKKHLEKFGDEHGNGETVEALREKLREQSKSLSS